MTHRHIAQSLLLTLASMLSISTQASAVQPIKGVGVVIKRCESPPCRCCGQSSNRLAGGFFGNNSPPVDFTVALEGRCSHACGGCVADCSANPDGRIDYASDGPAGPFDALLASTSIYSVEPARISVNGADSLYDVTITLQGVDPLHQGPIRGAVVLAPGSVLNVGTTATVQSSSLDLHVTLTLVNVASGVAAGSPIEQDLHLTLVDTALPIARLADGSPDGHIVLGSDGTTARRVTYASPGGELQLKFASLDAGTPVSACKRSWGAVKTIYR